MKIEIERPYLVLKKLYYCCRCKTTVVLLNIFVESVILCLKDSLMNKCSNEQHLLKIVNYPFGLISSLLNKSI